MTTVKDIAIRCGVSTATVSNVLNNKKNVSEETRARVMKVIREDDFRPNYIARGLRTQRTKTIEVIAEDMSLLSSAKIVESITVYCEERKYKVSLQTLRLYARLGGEWYTQEKVYRTAVESILRSVKADGIIYVAGHGRTIRMEEENLEIPMVMAYEYSDSDKIPSVVIDDIQGSCEITKYLIGMGHTKIGLIGGQMENRHVQERMKGYQKALLEAKILYDPELVRCGPWGRSIGYNEMSFLLERGVTAVFCMSDTIAGGVYDYCVEHGITVGKDISVAGYNNQEISEFLYPKLTSVDRNLMEIGYQAACLLIGKLEGDNIAVEGKKEIVKCPCSLVVRDSVKNINS